MIGRFLAAASHGWSPAVGSDGKAPVDPIQYCTLQFVPFCYFSEDTEAPSLLRSLSLAANSGLPATIRKHAIIIQLNMQNRTCILHGSILEIF
jgi:hypothetical protein